MAWFPIAHTVPQYVNSSGTPYSGAVLKAYSAGTSTPINMAIDSTGATEVGSIALNASGYPSVSGNVVIPYVEEKYKLMLYPTQAAADANSGSIWSPDNIPISGDFGAVTQAISTTTVLDASDNFNHIEASGTITITEPNISDVGSFVHTIRNAGSGVVTLTAGASDAFNGGSDAGSIFLYPGDFALIQSGTNWSAGISRSKRIHIYAGFHATANADEIPINGSSIALTSGGTYNGAQYATLYSYLWTNLADAEAAVTGGRGATAVADFAANKKITLPDYRDYALIGVSGAGSITTVGATAGASTVVPTGSITINAVTLSTANLPVVSPTIKIETGAADTNNLATALAFGQTAGGGANLGSNTTPDLSNTLVNSFGSGSSFTPIGTTTINSTSILQKSAGVYWYINF